MSPEESKEKPAAQDTATEKPAPEAVPETPADEEAVREHDLDPLTAGETSGRPSNIDLLMDVSVPVVAQLGATEIRIKDILELLPGSIVELDKLAGEPVDLLVRGQAFAQGEVVVVDENFGIRVTKILTPHKNAETIAAG